jgi:hypothetical protein
MRPDARFLGLPKHFWANVRTIGQAVGYTVRGEGVIRVPSMEEIRRAYARIGLTVSHLVDEGGTLLPLGRNLLEYLEHRADVLNTFVEPRLMDADRARKVFMGLRAKLKPSCPLPMNKQKGKKKAPAFLTGIVNMLIEASAEGVSIDYDPRELTTVTHDGAPVRTLARRIDGAFPGPVNPVAIWEIKEYYHTTTFGSRVADGVYETLLDGMELEELARDEGIHVEHLLIVDARYTWWECGKSYLCRLLDMLHMGYVDEVLFGYEVVEHLPHIVRGWVQRVGERQVQ